MADVVWSVIVAQNVNTQTGPSTRLVALKSEITSVLIDVGFFSYYNHFALYGNIFNFFFVHFKFVFLIAELIM